MRWRPKRGRVPGEYPESFVKRWMARTLPSTSAGEAASAVRNLRSKGWTEQQLAEFILPYMPRDVPRPAAPDPQAERSAVLGAPVPGPAALGEQAERARPVSLPPDVTRQWLDQHLPGVDGRRLRLVVDELERRGWSSGQVAGAVLPHLLPTLPAEDARAVVAGLADLGMTDEEIARATTPPEERR